MKQSLFFSTLIVLGVFLMTSCNDEDQSKLTIVGHLDNAAGQTLLIQAMGQESVPDTAIVGLDGSFKLTMDNPKMDFFRFFTKDMKEPVLLAFDSTQRSISLQGDVNDLIATYRVTGSKDSELLQAMAVKKLKFKHDMDSIVRMQKQLPPNADAMIRNAMSQEDEKLKAKFDTEFKAWAIENSKSLAGLAIISEVDLLKAIPEYKKLRNDLQTVVPGSIYLSTMDQNILNLEKAAKQKTSTADRKAHLKTGAPAPEISQPTPQGNSLSLSSLKGKYVLIDFWASWCGPCRRENPNVKRLYDKYGGSEFEILSVSLDSNKERWVQAIAQDKMNWLHVSDLKKWSSAAAAAYGVSSIPFTVLVDKEGNIITTGLRGKALQTKLEELFGA